VRSGEHAATAPLRTASFGHNFVTATDDGLMVLCGIII